MMLFPFAICDSASAEHAFPPTPKGIDMDEEILEELIRRYPGARLTSADQSLSETDFQAQKHKYFSRRTLGGAIGVIRNVRGQIVLVKRSGMHAGWALPGGTVEGGEDFSGAFCREIAEEIRISVVAPDLIELERKKFVSPQGDTFDFLLAVFGARMPEEELPGRTEDAVAEGLEVALFDPTDIPSEMILGDRRKLERHLLELEAWDRSPRPRRQNQLRGPEPPLFQFSAWFVSSVCRRR